MTTITAPLAVTVASFFVIRAMSKSKTPVSFGVFMVVYSLMFVSVSVAAVAAASLAFGLDTTPWEAARTAAFALVAIVGGAIARSALSR